ncbi:uncharacterized protein LOC125239955 isoform X1 [Leguminivora glycinivorella]|uniref:uncharacterized protein LOC125239955 isoform X1 n=1 Tax=Leguminivora glycinivorella TaxID=1035111 RepID=UPI00200ECA42|nr:uncharacterized protein LOC125239955 isoform X1 [Leguminivora glycinivorella]XP_048003702.1 uncharacterized protein LOC125239955 isoform X1 [Leguminivora glycinivorella]
MSVEGVESVWVKSEPQEAADMCSDEQAASLETRCEADVDVKREPLSDTEHIKVEIEVDIYPELSNSEEFVCSDTTQSEGQRTQPDSKSVRRIRSKRKLNNCKTSENDKKKTYPMTSRCNIDLSKRTKIISLRKQGKNMSEIARETGVNRKTVSLWVHRYQQKKSLRDQRRSGRPSLIDDSQRQLMIKEFGENGFKSTHHYAMLFGTSVDTVRRVLHSAGLRWQK